MSNREISKELGVTERTVKQYIMRAASKLGCYEGGKFNTRIRIVYLLWKMGHELAEESILAARH